MFVVLLSVSGCVCLTPVEEFADDFDAGASGGGGATGGGSGGSGGGTSSSSGGGVGSTGGGAAATGGGAAATGGGAAATGGGAGASGGGTQTGDAGAEPTLYAVARPDCAPNDGAAVHMYLSFDPLDCPVPSGEGLLIDLWVDELSPGTFTLSPGFSGDGTACSCGVVANFIQSGAVRVDEVDGGTARGRVDLTFQQGADVHGPLQVKLCPGVRQCG